MFSTNKDLRSLIPALSLNLTSFILKGLLT